MTRNGKAGIRSSSCRACRRTKLFLSRTWDPGVPILTDVSVYLLKIVLVLIKFSRFRGASTEEGKTVLGNPGHSNFQVWIPEHRISYYKVYHKLLVSLHNIDT